jgi:RHS repeat-associated protein
VATDRLGSVRANSQGERFAYYPYGEERSSTVDGREKFGTYFRDGVGQDYADQRYYNSGMGRFWSPDPLGLNSADPTNPISWNRYLYVNGEPVNTSDREGLDPDSDDPDCPPNPCAPYPLPEDGLAVPRPCPGPVGPPPPPPPPAPSCSFSVIVEGGAGGHHLPFAYHTAIQVDYGNGIDIDYEAFPVAKTASQNPNNLNRYFGGSWLNKSQTTGSVQGTVEYTQSGTSVCPEDAAITAAFASWSDNTTSYYFYPQNSNSFAHWLLDQADVQISASASAWMYLHVAGWSWNPTGQGN